MHVLHVGVLIACRLDVQSAAASVLRKRWMCARGGEQSLICARGSQLVRQLASLTPAVFLVDQCNAIFGTAAALLSLCKTYRPAPVTFATSRPLVWQLCP
jgi:hypothetical protein